MNKREKGSVEIVVGIFLVLVCVGLLVWMGLTISDNKKEARNSAAVVNNRQVEVGGQEFVITEIDGCEYFFAPSGPYHAAILTHKGNCKNSIHYGK